MLPDGSGVSVGGWTISTGHGPITGAPPPAASAAATAADALPSARLRALSCQDQPNLHPAADSDLENIKHGLGILASPEQFYGANFLRLRHDASGTVLRCGEACCRQGSCLAMHSRDVESAAACAAEPRRKKPGWAADGVSGAACRCCHRLAAACRPNSPLALLDLCRSFTALDALKGWLSDKSGALGWTCRCAWFRHHCCCPPPRWLVPAHAPAPLGSAHRRLHCAEHVRILGYTVCSHRAPAPLGRACAHCWLYCTVQSGCASASRMSGWLRARKMWSSTQHRRWNTTGEPPRTDPCLPAEGQDVCSVGRVYVGVHLGACCPHAQLTDR